MIQENQYNTAWWGDPVGEVRDDAFFSLSLEEQHASLERFSWVEHRRPLADSSRRVLLSRLGFLLVDVQIPFRLSLRGIGTPAEADQIGCKSAKEYPFEVELDEIRDFHNERFLQIPGVTIECLNRRYVSWANQLIQEYPAWCLEISCRDKVQGWFLSQSTPRGVWLMLAMGSKQATMSGLHLFQMALSTYAHTGATVGFASFSVQNTSVMNIYSHLGAKFLPPEGTWLWLGTKLRESSHRNATSK